MQLWPMVSVFVQLSIGSMYQKAPQLFPFRQNNSYCGSPNICIQRFLGFNRDNADTLSQFLISVKEH